MFKEVNNFSINLSFIIKNESHEKTKRERIGFGVFVIFHFISHYEFNKSEENFIFTDFRRKCLESVKTFKRLQNKKWIIKGNYE